MRTLEHQNTEKRQSIATETLEIYVPTAHLLGLSLLREELEDLCFKVLDPEKYNESVDYLTKQDHNNHESLQTFKTKISEILNSNGINAEVGEFVSSFYRRFKKYTAVGQNILEISDPLKIRISVAKREDCYLAMGAIHEYFKPIGRSFQDFIAIPRANGYQSLHTTVLGVNGVLTELHIGTKRMAIYANYGIMAKFNEGENDIESDSRSIRVWNFFKNALSGYISDDFIQDLKDDIFEDRITIFSNDGTDYDLPDRATLLDFSFLIDHEKGKFSDSGTINGRAALLSEQLESGDLVTIKYTDTPQIQLSWIGIAKTRLARNYIRLFLSSQKPNERIYEGRKLLQKDMDIHGLGEISDFNFEHIKKRLQALTMSPLSSFNDLFYLVGIGELKTDTIVSAIEKYKSNRNFISSLLAENLLSLVLKNNSGLTIQLITKSRVGILRDVSRVFYNFSLNMVEIRAFIPPFSKDGHIYIQIDNRNFDKLNELFRDLEKIEGVYSVKRVYNKSTVFFSSLVFISLSEMVLNLWGLNSLYISEVNIKTIFGHIVFHGVTLLSIYLLYLLNEVNKKYLISYRQNMFLRYILFRIPITVGIFSSFLFLFYHKNITSIVIFVMIVGIIFASKKIIKK